jgi:hypothetical protein
MDGGGDRGEVIGTGHIIMIMDGVTIREHRVFMQIPRGEDITEVTVGTVTPGTIDGFLINNLYVGLTGITDINI